MSSQDNVPIGAGTPTGKGSKKPTPPRVDSPKTRDLKETTPTSKGVGSKGKVSSSEDIYLKGQNTPVSNSPITSPKEETRPPSPGRPLLADGKVFGTVSDAGQFSAEVLAGELSTEHFKVYSGETEQSDRIHGASSPFPQSDRMHGVSPFQQSDRIHGEFSPTRTTVTSVERRSYRDVDSDEDEESDDLITEAERERLLQETAEAFKNSDPPKATPSPVSQSPFGETTEENQVPMKPVVTQDRKGNGSGVEPPVAPQSGGTVEASVKLFETRKQEMIQKQKADETALKEHILQLQTELKQ